MGMGEVEISFCSLNVTDGAGSAEAIPHGHLVPSERQVMT